LSCGRVEWWRRVNSEQSTANREQEQQIPFGNDSQKSKSKNKSNRNGNRRFPAGMTTRERSLRALGWRGVRLTKFSEGRV